MNEDEYEEVAEFFGYLRGVRVEGSEVVFTVHSSSPEVFDLIRRSFDEEIDSQFPDPSIWFKFKASRLA